MKKTHLFGILTSIFLLLLMSFGVPAFSLDQTQALEKFQNLPLDVQEKLQKQYFSGRVRSYEDILAQVQKRRTGITSIKGRENGAAREAGTEQVDLLATEATAENDIVSALEKQFRKHFQSELASDLKQFGYNLFSTSSTAVPQIVVPGDEYVVTPGDQLRIRLWGASVDTEYVAVVEADGSLNVPKIGVVPVAGEQLGYLEGKIKNEALKYMQGINISLALEKLHSVEIYVIGEVARPGLHVVPAFSSLFKGLQAAGGVNKSGTLRKIKLYRSGTPATEFDLYDLVFKGSRKGDKVLRNQDVIFVPRINDMVAVAGAVQQPAIYEMSGEKSLAQFIDYAGGYLPNAYKRSFYVKRYQNDSEFQVFAVQDAAGTQVQSGDFLEIPFAPETQARVVSLVGHVNLPQVFSYVADMTLADVLNDVAALKPEALTDYGLLHHFNEQTTRYEVQKFPLQQLLEGSYNLPLLPYDRIEVLSREELGIKETVGISGAVWRPNTYAFTPGLTVVDLIALAGGIKDHEFIKGSAYLYRYDPDILQYEVQRLDLERLDSGTTMLLQPFDKIELLSRKDYDFDESVRISGAVRKSGEYLWRKSLSVRDLIDMAGGPVFGAQLDRVEVTQVVIQQDESMIRHKSIDFQQQADFQLQPYDFVMVPKVAKATHIPTVTIEGEVLYPGRYSLQKGERLSDVIRRAGGFTDKAYFYGARFSSQQAQQIQQRNIDKMIDRLQLDVQRTVAEASQLAVSQEGVAAAELSGEAAGKLIAEMKQIKADGRISLRLGPLADFSKTLHDFELRDGDSLYVPNKPDFIAVVGSVYSPNSFVYEPKLTVRDYLKLSGGPTKDADKDYIYVQKANGEVVSAQQKGLFSSIYGQKLMPGDTVVVLEKLDRVPTLRLFKDLTEIIFRIAVTTGIAFAI